MKLCFVLVDIRSCFNVGSLLRTADGLGVSKVYFSGLTPYPNQKNDTRLPHLSTKIHNKITKTSLGAENSVEWEYGDDIHNICTKLQSAGWELAALEQTASSVSFPLKTTHKKLALLLGNEITGLPGEVIDFCDFVIEIPMKGEKESFNVAVAGSIAAYQLLN